MAQDESVLTVKAGSLEALSQQLIDGDPEVDVENFGRFLSDTSRVYVNPENENRASHRAVGDLARSSGK